MAGQLDLPRLPRDIPHRGGNNDTVLGLRRTGYIYNVHIDTKYLYTYILMGDYK